MSCSLFKFLSTNHPPEKPFYLFPENASENIEIEDIILEWNCFDQDKDSLRYDIYFSMKMDLDSLDILTTDHSGNFYELPELDFDTFYYWKIIAFDGEFESESEIWSFKTKTYFPDWWLVQDNPDYIYSFGTDIDESQVDSHNYAFEKAIAEKKIFIQAYLENLLKKFILEANITDPLSLSMKDKLVEVVSEKDYPDFFMSRQETIISHSEEYQTYVRIHLPKKIINRKLYEKVILTQKLFEDLHYSSSFQQFIKENSEDE